MTGSKDNESVLQQARQAGESKDEGHRQVSVGLRSGPLVEVFLLLTALQKAREHIVKVHPDKTNQLKHQTIGENNLSLLTDKFSRAMVQVRLHQLVSIRLSYTEVDSLGQTMLRDLPGDANQQDRDSNIYYAGLFSHIHTAFTQSGGKDNPELKVKTQAIITG